MRELAHVAPVVVAEHDRDVVRRAVTLVPVALHLLVQGLHLGSADHPLLPEDLPLAVDDGAHQVDAVAVRQADVAVAPHAERHDTLDLLFPHPLGAVPPGRATALRGAAAALEQGGRDDGRGRQPGPER